MVVAGSPADKSARLVAPDEAVVVLGPPARFVSRGGLKLEAALDRFSVEVAGHRAIDAGASTGGFTDCLLQRGADHVYAVDVGHGQLHQRLRADGRVTVLERVNVRSLTPELLQERDGSFVACSLVTADVSFISLTSVLPALCGPVSRQDAELVLLIKPQFEAGRAVVNRGKGVVRDPEVWVSTLTKVLSALQAAGTGIMGVMVSPLTGPAGNVEFLTHARKGAEPVDPAALGDTVASVVDAAVGRAE